MGRTCLLAWKNKSDSLREEESGEDNVRCFWNLVSSLQEWHWSMQGRPEAEKKMLENGETSSSSSFFFFFLEDYSLRNFLAGSFRKTKVNLSCSQHLNKQMQK